MDREQKAEEEEDVEMKVEKKDEKVSKGGNVKKDQNKEEKEE